MGPSPCLARGVSNDFWSSWKSAKPENQKSLLLALERQAFHPPGRDEGASRKMGRPSVCRMWTRFSAPSLISWICGWCVIRKTVDRCLLNVYCVAAVKTKHWAKRCHFLHDDPHESPTLPPPSTSVSNCGDKLLIEEFHFPSVAFVACRLKSITS